MADKAALSSEHPEYVEQKENWVLLRDSFKGERAIKKKTTIYLPLTSGQIADGAKTTEQPGAKAYTAYILRARYTNFIRQAVQSAIGMMHSHPPKISLPEELKNITTTRNETMSQLLRRINEEQLTTGRIGILLDIPSSGTPRKDLPYLATYVAESIVNWDDGTTGSVPQTLNLVVLDESEFERLDNFSWELVEKFRVLKIGGTEENEQQGLYKFGVFKDESFSEEGLMAPSFRGKTLNQIPFIFINSCDLVSEPDEPPLLDLANLSVTIYRGEADYRQNLFMQGQDTFVTIGATFDEDDTIRTGAGARIDLPQGGDAKYVGVQSDGLEEQRTALENDKKLAGSSGAQTIDTTSRERESGDSLRIRVSARTADLNQIAITGAKGLEDILKVAAEWIGADPDEVKVEPNLEFADSGLSGQSMVEIQTARNLGYPISAQSLHLIAFNKGMTVKSFEEEMEAAKKDEDSIFKKMEKADRAPGQVSE